MVGVTTRQVSPSSSGSGISRSQTSPDRARTASANRGAKDGSPAAWTTADFRSAIAAGSAFSATLQQSTQAWARNPSAGSLENIRGWSLKLPYIGICAGICVTLASGIQLFGFSADIAYGLGMVMTLLMALLVWRQLGVILTQIQTGGSKALDLDAF